jgi:hypothetical protein
MITRSFVLAACLLAAPAPLAAAESVYTRFKAMACKTISTDEVGGVETCKGLGGMPVLVVDGDSRIAVSYGPKAEDEPAAKLFFGPLNGVGDTLEWRVGANRRAFATILRWRLSLSGDEAAKPGDNAPLLVITRLPPGPVCHVAYVDAGANPNANELARQAADEARAFVCGEQKARLVGKPGRASGLIKALHE